MIALNREMIEEARYWEELGLHIEFDPSINTGVTEEELQELYEQIDEDNRD